MYVQYITSARLVYCDITTHRGYPSQHALINTGLPEISVWLFLIGQFLARARHYLIRPIREGHSAQ